MAMSGNPLISSMSNIFDSACENLEIVLNHLKDDESHREEKEGFTLATYWTCLNGSTAAVTKEATMLCMAFSKPPAPTVKECEPLIGRLEKAVLTMVSAYYGLPKTQGQTLRKSTSKAVVFVVEALLSLLRTIKTEGSHGSASQLQSTGSVWEHCDSFPHLPKDNKEAAVKVAQEASGMVKDALEELEEAQNEDEDEGISWDEVLEADGQQPSNQDSWSDADRQLLASCSGLVKAAKSCLKKTSSAVNKNGNCSSGQNIDQLDDLADLMVQISPVVDDFVSGLYPPLTHAVVRENAQALADKLTQLLQKSKHTHVTTEDDQQWVQFLLKAVQHNLTKIHSMAQEHG